MFDIKFMFIAIMVLGLLSVAITGGIINEEALEQNKYLIIGIVPTALASLVMFKFRNSLIFAIKYKDRELTTDRQLGTFLGVDSVKVRHDHFISTANGRMVGHALIRIVSIAYSLDDLDRDKKMHLVGNFARVLSSFSFTYEYKVRILPVSADAILNQIDRKINGIRLTLSGQGSLKDPKKETQLRNLEKMKERILEGEGVLDVAFTVHIMSEGENENNIANRLNENCKAMMSALESSLNVRAERLAGGSLVTVMREFFTAGTKIIPSKTNRMLNWDLSYLTPLAKPKRPPTEKLLSGVYMGKTSDGGMFLLDLPKATNPHMVVLGLSGSGKSTTVKTYISRNYDVTETPTVIVDYAGEYTKWVSSRNGKVIDMREYAIGLFSLGNSSVQDKIAQLTESFGVICEFNSLQRIVFSNYLRKLYNEKGDSVTLTDLINLMTDELERLKPNRQRTVVAIVDRLKGLTNGPFDTTGKPFIALDEIIKGFVCIDLSKLSSNPLKSMVAYTILQYIDSTMRIEGTSDLIKLVIALDEA